METKILISSPVRQKPKVLKKFLSSLAELDKTGLKADFMFIDNNDVAHSSQLLKEFSVEGCQVFIEIEPPIQVYTCNEVTHYWNNDLIWKLAGLKNYIFKFALDNNYSHVFIIDSDIVLHPLTLKYLLASGKDIISEIFWTKWNPNSMELPQVWLSGQYSFHYGGAVSQEVANSSAIRFFNQLRIPGVYEVGGLGACTLFSRKAIAGGVHFGQIPNLDYWGEDRHLSIRAAVLGFKLYVDTNCPAFHIYRESELPRVRQFKQVIEQQKASMGPKWSQISTWQRKSNGNKVTLSMIVKNEADRYLPRVLEHARKYIDAAVIIDDASTDNTVEICRQMLEGIPLKIISRGDSSFAEEYKLRQQQWQETINTDPDWILVLDADEILDNSVTEELPRLINQTDVDVYYLRLYDFWNEDHYREDDYWKAHLYHRPFLVRYVPGFNYLWRETPQHCGRLPLNITQLNGGLSEIRVKHYGWASAGDREFKYNRYLELDPGARYGIKEQYESILDPNPRLIRWEE